MWDLYLAYCEAAFLDRHIGDVQLLLAKPATRRVLFDEPMESRYGYVRGSRRTLRKLRHELHKPRNTRTTPIRSDPTNPDRVVRVIRGSCCPCKSAARAVRGVRVARGSCCPWLVSSVGHEQFMNGS